MPAKKNKRGPLKGSGGKGRRALEGKKGTPPAHQRHWYEKKQRERAEERARRAAERPAPAAKADPDGPELLAGRNAVVEALRAGFPAGKLYLVNSLAPDDRVTEAARLAGDAGLEIVEVTRPELDRRCEEAGHPGAAHQGIALRVRPYRYTGAEDLLEQASANGGVPLLVALDGVTDPHNLGAVARSAAAFGAHGLIIPERRSAGVTLAAWKTSAGTLARLPVAQVTNLTRTIQKYKREGVFAVGLDGDGESSLDTLPVATEPLLVVVGAEGGGLSRLVRQNCDMVAAIPISGAESLNASVAAGVALYEVARRRTTAERSQSGYHSTG